MVAEPATAQSDTAATDTAKTGTRLDRTGNQESVSIRQTSSVNNAAEKGGPPWTSRPHFALRATVPHYHISESRSRSWTAASLEIKGQLLLLRSKGLIPSLSELREFTASCDWLEGCELVWSGR